mmetsp:Transcript_28255/g.24968  ORF Transcript_28255/g.24968 Transcript_28255/m.24968 type:complete len:110 (+) Transcript_28255:812-1141(+)
MERNLGKAQENEKILMMRIQKLEEEQNTSNSRYEEMEQLVKQLLVKKTPKDKYNIIKNNTLEENYVNLDVKRDSIGSLNSFKTHSDGKGEDVLELIKPIMAEVITYKDK